jgi:hypothetical protein
MCLPFTLTDSLFTVTLDPRQFLSDTFFSVAWNLIKGTAICDYFMKFLDAKLIKLQCACLPACCICVFLGNEFNFFFLLKQVALYVCKF